MTFSYKYYKDYKALLKDLNMISEPFVKMWEKPRYIKCFILVAFSTMNFNYIALQGEGGFIGYDKTAF